MNLSYLISVCERRITYLLLQKESALEVGDMAQIERIENEITTTQTTLNQLNSLL